MLDKYNLDVVKAVISMLDNHDSYNQLVNVDKIDEDDMTVTITVKYKINEGCEPRIYIGDED